MKIQEPGATVTHVYSGLDVVHEKQGTSVTKHYYANGLHLAENRDGTVEYYHQDHLGSTRLKTDSGGSSVFSRNYEPFGPDHGGSGSEEYKYTGKREDPSGLYYYGARYYDPNVGRFITEDPVPGGLMDPQSLNRYVYCRNNPHKYTDPDGRLLDPVTFITCWSIARSLLGASYEMYKYTVDNWGNPNTKEFIMGYGRAGTKGIVTGGIQGLGESVAIVSGGIGGVILVTGAHLSSAPIGAAVGAAYDKLTGTYTPGQFMPELKSDLGGTVGKIIVKGCDVYGGLEGQYPNVINPSNTQAIEDSIQDLFEADNSEVHTYQEIQFTNSFSIHDWDMIEYMRTS